MAQDIEKPKETLTTVDQVIESMPRRFHPENCKKIEAIYQWALDKPERTFHVKIDKGTFELNDGAHPSPNVTIMCDTEVYLKLVNGQMKDVMAVVTGKLRVKGNLALAQKLGKIFI